MVCTKAEEHRAPSEAFTEHGPEWEYYKIMQFYEYLLWKQKLRWFAYFEGPTKSKMVHPSGGSFPYAFKLGTPRSYEKLRCGSNDVLVAHDVDTTQINDCTHARMHAIPFQ